MTRSVQTLIDGWLRDISETLAHGKPLAKPTKAKVLQLNIDTSGDGRAFSRKFAARPLIPAGKSHSRYHI